MWTSTTRARQTSKTNYCLLMREAMTKRTHGNTWKLKLKENFRTTWARRIDQIGQLHDMQLRVPNLQHFAANTCASRLQVLRGNYRSDNLVLATVNTG